MSLKSRGKVFLVGAGPGDLELLTLKAARVIGQADLLLLDALVNPDIVKFAKRDAQVITVGKRAGCKSTTQSAIHQKMVKSVNEGLCVARVKGGDPFVFGRGGEEVEALLKAGIEVESINGISAGLAAPTVLGIPLSHRDCAHTITFITGHDTASEYLNWRSIADGAGTIVIYMGIKNVAAIVENLLMNGLASTTPAAVVQNATLPEERKVMTRLYDLPAMVVRETIVSPAIIIIGHVVALSPSFDHSCLVQSQTMEIA